MEEVLKERAMFLLIAEPNKSLVDCVDQAINELVPSEYIRDCATMFDLTYEDVRIDLRHRVLKIIN